MVSACGAGSGKGTVFGHPTPEGAPRATGAAPADEQAKGNPRQRRNGIPF
jgi:hypothetical protein